jgi:catechol 2,3-dioxygenase-like lactoylglutathione lyase family enzyme
MASRSSVVATLLVRDYDRSLKFYCSIGFEPHIDADLGTTRHCRLQLPEIPGFELTLIGCSTPAQFAAVGQQCGNVPWLCIPTTDCRAVYQKLRLQQIQGLGDFTELPYVVCPDPDGNRVALIETF